MPKKKKKTAKQKYGNGTTYRVNGKKVKRVAFPGTQRGHNFCSRTYGQKRTEKVKQRRRDWGCRGKRSYKK